MAYENRDIRVKELMEKLRIKLLGHYRYYGVSHNSTMIGTFRHRTIEEVIERVTTGKVSMKC